MATQQTVSVDEETVTLPVRAYVALMNEIEDLRFQMGLAALKNEYLPEHLRQADLPRKGALRTVDQAICVLDALGVSAVCSARSAMSLLRASGYRIRTTLVVEVLRARSSRQAGALR